MTDNSENDSGRGTVRAAVYDVLHLNLYRPYPTHRDLIDAITETVMTRLSEDGFRVTPFAAGPSEHDRNCCCHIDGFPCMAAASAEPVWIDCTCGHPKDNHDMHGCFPACGCTDHGPGPTRPTPPA